MVHDLQELTLRQEASDAAGEARAHSHLGAVHMALGHYSHAARCYRVSDTTFSTSIITMVSVGMYS